jgi:hypothetical protein
MCPYAHPSAYAGVLTSVSIRFADADALQLGWSVEGMRRIQRHASELLPRIFLLVAEHFPIAAPAVMQQVGPEASLVNI